ncbi:MAG: IS630 family transposase [Proteobacteria bacterium]|nr:IS630 family transposase [Pseudomonadota bacterium]
MNKSKALDQLRKQLRKAKKQKSHSRSNLRTIIRLKVLIAYYKGNRTDSIASCYDVSERSIKNWIKKFESYGNDSMEDDPRAGRPTKLPEKEAEELKRIITKNNQRVWVARHVYGLLISVFGVSYSVKYLPELLKKLGLSFRKAVHFLVRRDSEKRKEWIKEKLPKIYEKKIKHGWRIFFQDEVGFATEGTLAHTWGEKAKKIEIENHGRHGRMNLIGAFELGTGVFHGVLTSFSVNACRFRRFICHLKRKMRTDRILLICDNASFHKAKWFTEWSKEQSSWLKLEFLPAYSPDFNPIERLWRWMKTEFIHNRCWKTKGLLKKHLFGVLDEVPSYSEDLKSLMKKENERFGSICDFYENESFELFNTMVLAT